MQIHGNTTGLTPSQRKALERVYRRRVPFDRLTTPELSRGLCDVSHATGRQVGAMVHRSGQVQYVIIGDAAKLDLPDIGRVRGGSGRFRGLRLIHTHLRNEPLTRDDLVDLTRLRLDMIAAICLSPEGNPQQVHYGHCVPVADGRLDDPFRTFGPIPHGQLQCDPAAILSALEEEFARAARTRKVEAKDGRAILVHVCDKRSAGSARESLDELCELARTAGVDVADTILQVRDRVDPKFVLGRGKLEDTMLRAMQLDAEVLIMDTNLSAAQAAGITKMTELKVIDRTQLILDIFAQRAESLDGKLQVELAQTRYLLPRLGAKDDSLSRLTGGIGGRGPGETKLEVGRRRARERIAHLQSRLKHSARQREQRRHRRQRGETPVIAIVGYTNAGKSTLLNTMAGADVLAEDKLFATLDTRARRSHIPGTGLVVLTDTVGFIRELPAELFDAFRATFEEAGGAQLLLQVVDASDPNHELHLDTTEEVLRALELEAIPRLIVFNKTDRLDAQQAQHMADRHGGVAVSARDRTTLDPLHQRIAALLDVGEPAAPRHGDGDGDGHAELDVATTAQ